MPKWLIPAGVLALALFVLFGCYGNANSIRNEAIARENQLSAQYVANQNTLSNFISTFYETVGIADRKSDQLDRILTDAVKGRYDKEGYGSKSALFTSIREAYPSITGLEIYDKVVDQIRGGRQEYKLDQDKLLDMLQQYDTWRAKDFFRSWVLGKYFPSEHLVARIGTDRFTGAAAEEKMWQIVLVKEAKQAYTTGEMAPLQAPPLPPKK